MLANIRIEPSDKNYSLMKIFLNDEDVSKYVTGVSFEMTAGDSYPSVTLEVPAILQIPENIKANLLVFMPKDEEK